MLLHAVHSRKLESYRYVMFIIQVLIVDDGSKDKTSKVAFDFVRKYKIDNVRVILLGKNHGKGEAIRKVSSSYPSVVMSSLYHEYVADASITDSPVVRHGIHFQH